MCHFRQSDQFHNEGVCKVKRREKVPIFVRLSSRREYPGYLFDDLDIAHKGVFCREHYEEAEERDDGCEDKLCVDPRY